MFKTANALSCVENGYSGPKYPVSTISITSNTDFDALHPSGTSLNDIVLVKELMVGSTFIPLNSFDAAALFVGDVYVSRQQFYIAQRPTSAKEHVLTIAVQKSNGTATDQYHLLNMQGLLSLIVFIPLGAALILLAVPNHKQHLHRIISLLATCTQLGLSLLLWLQYKIPADGTSLTSSFQFVEQADWFVMHLGDSLVFRVEYFLGVDGFSLPLVMLSSLILVIGVISSWKITRQTKGYFFLYLLLATSIAGCFVALDFFLFYLFFELMLLPMFFLIGIWGGKRRSYASIKFFIYTLVGSMLILVVMIGLYVSAVAPGTEIHTFNLLYLMDGGNFLPGSLFATDQQNILWGLPIREIAFLALIFGFAIKLPVVPLHTWLPDAHVEAPTAISVILAGLLLKVGGYGILRIAYPIFPDVALNWSYLIAGFGVFSIVYGGMNALAQRDFKRLVAYSSVSHMGFVLLGIGSLTAEGVSGSLFHMISHGLISGALFLIVGVLYDRTGDRKIDNFSGLASKLPAFTVIVVIVFFASLGLPGLSGFVGEVLVLMGAFASYESNEIIPLTMAIVATTGILISAIYYLWTLQRMFFGKYWVRKSEWEPQMQDLSRREYVMFIPLIILIVILGVWPRLILDLSQETTLQFIQHLKSFSTY